VYAARSIACYALSCFLSYFSFKQCRCLMTQP